MKHTFVTHSALLQYDILLRLPFFYLFCKLIKELLVAKKKKKKIKKRKGLSPPLFWELQKRETLLTRMVCTNTVY